MSMNILKDAIRSVDRRETGTGLPDRVANVLHLLGASRNIDEDARADIISIMDDSVELASAMVNHTYPVELILRRVTNILSTSQRILMHTESFRPGRIAFGAMLPNGELLDLVASTQDEAMLQLGRLQQLGVSRQAVVVPIRIASQYVMQPQIRAVTAPAIPLQEGRPTEGLGTTPVQPPPPFTPPEGFFDPATVRHDREEQLRKEIDAIANEKEGFLSEPGPQNPTAPLPSTLK